MNDNTPTTSGTSQPGLASARRRLVGRAFAAPAVMTLFSGSAFAAASNLRCITNKTNGANQSYPPVGPADTWLRVQRYKLTLTAGGTQYWIRGSDVVALKGANAAIVTHLTSGQFQRTDATFNVVNTSPVDGLNVLTIDTGNFVAVRVNGLGQVVGIAGDGVTGMTSAIAQTCWSSFRG